MAQAVGSGNPIFGGFFLMEEVALPEFSLGIFGFLL